MNLLEWDDALNIDITDIDNRMKALFESINRYLAYDGRKHGEEEHDEISEVLAHVSESVRHHFSYEEKILTQYRYPEIEGHKKEHRRFMKKILTFRRMFTEEPDKTYRDSVKFMREWVVKHIEEVDMRYAPFVRVQKYLNEASAQNRRGR